MPTTRPAASHNSSGLAKSKNRLRRRSSSTIRAICSPLGNGDLGNPPLSYTTTHIAAPNREVEMRALYRWPQFSIRAILTLTLFIGVGIAALRGATGLWAGAMVLLALGLLCTA